MPPLDDTPSYVTLNDITALPHAFPRDILNPTLAKAFDYWRSIGEGSIPSRCQLTPAAMLPFLSGVLLWDHAPATDDFFCRLAGTRICEVAGRELRGQSLEQMHGTGSAAVRINFEDVVHRRSINFVQRRMSWVNRAYRQYERLLMPLTDETGAVRHLMGVITVDYD